MNRLATVLIVVILAVELSRTVWAAHADSASFTFESEQVSSIWRYLATGESVGAQPTDYHFALVVANEVSNITMVYHSSESHELEVGGEDSAFVQGKCTIRWVGKIEGKRVLGTISGSYTISADFWNYPTNPIGGFNGTFSGSWRGVMAPSGNSEGSFEMTWLTADSWGAFRSNPQIIPSLNGGNGEARGSWKANFSTTKEPSTTLVVIAGTLAVALVCAWISGRFLRSRKRLFTRSISAEN